MTTNVRLTTPPKPEPKEPPAWQTRARAAIEARRKAEERGERPATTYHVAGVGPTGEPRHEGAELRSRPLILEDTDLRPLGTRLTAHRGRRAVQRTWFAAKDGGEGYEVIIEVPPAALGDAQRTDQVLIHRVERVAGAIEEDRKGGRVRRIPHLDDIKHRWYRCRVHASGTWELAD